MAQLMGGKGSGRKPSPCGTSAKYQWHRKRGEDCATCKAAAAAYQRARYKPKLARARFRTTAERKATARALLQNEKLRRSNCCDCGMVVTPDNTYCFDFDHRDPHLKTASLSDLTSWGQLQKMQDEMDKCDLVCAICHRHRTMRQLRAGILTGTRMKRTSALPTLFDDDCLHG
jgi:hypothetical protein